MNRVKAAEASTKQKQTTVAKWLETGSINLFGLPFSGKDTQSRLLAQWLQAPIIGGGDILRSRRDTPAHVRTIMDGGKLAPSDDYLKIVTPYLSQPEFAGRPLVLSSIGRWQGEEQGILESADCAGHPLRAVIFLQVDEAVVHQRWQTAQRLAHRSQRADDANHLLAVRLDEFRHKTLPVLDFYRRLGLLITVNGHQSVELVQSEILQRLFQLAAPA